MPGFDGFQVLDAVKQSSEDIVVIIMTASDSSKLVTEALRRGTYACIIKPFRKEAILHMIGQVVASKMPEAG